MRREETTLLADVTIVEDGPRTRETGAEVLLESGHVLVCNSDLGFAATDLALLRTLGVTGKQKNVAYDLHKRRLSGLGAAKPETVADVRRILDTYAGRVTRLVAGLCPRYALAWRVDLTSFRPLEEAGRQLSARARNDRLHIDAFPSRPTNGDRILRVFTNIHPTQPRCWLSGDPLDQLLPAMRQLPGFPLLRPRRVNAHALRTRIAQRLGVPALGRSVYDRYMLRVHDFMKRSDELQRSCHPTRHELAPGLSWIVFTDAVPHAVLSGQYALEQTFIVSHKVLVAPERSPLALFERMSAAGSGT